MGVVIMSTARKLKKPATKRHRTKAANQDLGKELHNEWEAITKSVKKIAGRVKKGSMHNGGDMLRHTKKTMESNPLKTLGVACGIGVILGILLKK